MAWLPCFRIEMVISIRGNVKRSQIGVVVYSANVFFLSIAEAVVAESVVVIKKLLQTHPNAHTDIIKHMARLVDNITVPQARASILWLLGEYSHLVPKLAPDVLRKMAKTFVNEVIICLISIIENIFRFLVIKLVLFYRKI